MLRDILKQEIDRLNEGQLKRIAEFITFVKYQAQQVAIDSQFWKNATPTERVQDLQVWIEQLPKTGLSLPNEAFDRGSIYE